MKFSDWIVASVLGLGLVFVMASDIKFDHPLVGLVTFSFAFLISVLILWDAKKSPHIVESAVMGTMLAMFSAYMVIKNCDQLWPFLYYWAH